MKRKYHAVALIGIPVLVFLIVFGVFLRLTMNKYFAQRNVLNHGSRTLGMITEKGTYLAWDSGSYSSEPRHRISDTFTLPTWVPLTYEYDSGVDTGLKVGDEIEIAFDLTNPAVNFPVEYASKS